MRIGEFIDYLRGHEATRDLADVLAGLLAARRPVPAPFDVWPPADRRVRR